MTVKLFSFFIAFLCSTIAVAQIPNSNFEMWDTFATYKSPQGWDNLDSATNVLSVYTCERDSPSVGNNYYMKLTSKTTPLGIAPGIAVSGKIDFSGTSYTARSGFPLTSRPRSLTGQWQYMAWPGDEGFIAIFLSKWNSTAGKRDTIAFVNYPLAGMIMIWQPFSIDLNYYSGASPDSAIIVLSSSGPVPVAYSYLYVDTLGFSGSVPVGTVTLGAMSAHSRQTAVTVAPNPASSNTNITCYSKTGGTALITICDVNGRIIENINNKIAGGSNSIPVNTAHFTPGIYFIKVVTDEGTEEKKLVIQ